MRNPLLPLALAAWLPAVAVAQEATHTPAATQPAPGHYYFRGLVHQLSLSDDPVTGGDIDKTILTHMLAVGLTRQLSLSATLPLVYENRDPGETRAGFGDAALTLLYRPWQRDLGPTDSLRLAVLGGVELPTGTGDFSSHSFDPFLGAVFTAILGRHGFNQAVRYKFNTGGDPFSANIGDGPANALRADTAYLFRLAPERFGPQTDSAWYLTFELNALHESNGDLEILAGPGLLYEARRFALEVALSLPAYRDVEHRPRTDFMLTVGFRLLF